MREEDLDRRDHSADRGQGGQGAFEVAGADVPDQPVDPVDRHRHRCRLGAVAVHATR